MNGTVCDRSAFERGAHHLLHSQRTCEDRILLRGGGSLLPEPVSGGQRLRMHGLLSRYWISGCPRRWLPAGSHSREHTEWVSISDFAHAFGTASCGNPRECCRGFSGEQDRWLYAGRVAVSPNAGCRVRRGSRDGVTHGCVRSKDCHQRTRDH